MSNTRRSRFTVYIEGRDPQVILAYSAMSAREFYARRGWITTKVVKGDYRKAARATAPRPAGSGFQIDRKALADAIDLLGIKMPVKIRYHAREGNTLGNYRFKTSWHDIMLKSYHTPEQASSTLWHELTHAMQAERAIAKGQTWADFTRAQKRYSYSNRPIEVEARQMSADMADCPLTKALR